MWLLLISICFGGVGNCNYTATPSQFSTFKECLAVGHAALNDRESAARINDYRCVKIN